MHTKLSTYYLAICCSLFLLLTHSVQAAETGVYSIQNIEADVQDNSLLMVLKGDSPPAYTMYELFSPARLVVDIADANLNESIDLAEIIPANDFTTITITTLKDKSPSITRFEMTLADSHTYKVERVENDLTIRLFPQDTTGTTELKADKNIDATAPPALHDIVVRKDDNQTEILFQADQAIEDYREDTVTGRDGLPDSMYIDINNVNGSELIREKNIGTSLSKIRVATRGSGVRVVFDAAPEGLFSYDIKTVPQGLLVTINEKGQQQNAPESVPAPEELKDNSISAEAITSDPTLDALIDSSEAALTQKSLISEENVTAAEAMQDSFEFSGYKATRISVDFYKIDLHNVFRLFRQISGINLIVDESVNGSLTLALNDVPWDFALDIILNLKDLKKEERHNTVVIYPAKKEFAWPERASDNLSFEADAEVIEQEALIIQQSTNQPAEIMQAKELLRRAKIEEQNNDLEDAVRLYEQAFALWPENAKISNRLAALYLVDLKIYAKAIHFAKETLKINKNDYQAALYGAIASANMDQVSEAMEYFAQSISGTPPMKEALISYAAFSEKKEQPEAALKLLNKYAENYSDTVETMISRARLYDTMGQTQKATEQYKSLLYSGYQLVPGLKKYIRGRLAMKDNQIVQ
ncbi:type II secretory pathway, component HofQ [Desulfocapsa sulfexigens DSM 10523]|uniref:Type II secretory pathway, component HofQ n=1 Tax=Desulfocapsa sulfexigens (strain DSM 10523 / SB164P1) TaxID=1167006 RepID=M1PLN6_DESSD|nr:AMIN domain-containing protein [Desulfocapsa sulfexigens]AGF77376.1 type II secretory pathway, component HofQ [Desulfocapsa sulfexigens DSM 10523]